MRKKNRTTNKTLGIFLSLFLLSVFSLPACSPDHGKKTAMKAEKGEGDIVIGAVYPFSQKGAQFINGFNLAVDELNSRPDGVLGRKFKPIFRDDESSPKKSKEIAVEFARNHDLVAVLGHNTSVPAISASIVYENSQIVFITQRATSDHLTEHGFKFVFRNMTENSIFAQKIVDYVKRDAKNKKILVLAMNDSYGKDLSTMFQAFAKDAGIVIVGPITFNPWETKIKESFLRYANFIEETKFDDVFNSIFVAASNPFASKVIKVLRDLNVTGNIYSSEGLDDHELIEIAGDDAENVIFCTVKTPSGPKYEEFAARYRYKYGMEPDGWAAATYDSVHLLAYCMEKAGTTVPKTVAEVMHFMQDWPGVTGMHTFNSAGELLTEKPLAFKTVHEKELVFIEDIE